MSDLIPGGYVSRRPKPSDLAGTQRAINALAAASDASAAAFEDTYRTHIEDTLALHEEFTGHGFPSLEATILTLATIMLTPEGEPE